MAIYDMPAPQRRGIIPFVSDDQGLGAMPQPARKSATATKSSPSGAATDMGLRPAPAQPIGTRIGQDARLGTQALVNLGIRGVNAADRSVVGAVNGQSYPFRAAAGFVRDAARAGLALPASSNAGNPTLGLVPKQLHTLSGPLDSNPAPASVAPAATQRVGAPALTRAPVVMNPTLDQLRAAGASPQFDVSRIGAGVNPDVADPGALPQNRGNTLDDAAAGGLGTPPRSLTRLGGRMVNGVATFSDGSSNTIPQTVTGDVAPRQDLNSGGSFNVVPATAFTQAGGALDSPDSEANIRARMRADQGPMFAAPTARDQTIADLRAIASGDWRTSLGTAASNLRQSLHGSPSMTERRADQSALNDLTGGVLRADLAQMQGDESAANTRASGQNALQRTGLAGQYSLAEQNARNAGQLANTNLAGNFGLQRSAADNAAALRRTQIAGQNALDVENARTAGQLADTSMRGLWASQAPRASGVTNADAMKLVSPTGGFNILNIGTDGKIRDPNNPKDPGHFPSRAEMAQGLEQARAMLSMAQRGAAPQQASPDGSLTTGRPTLEQVRNAALAQNPNLTDDQIREYYAQNYGTGG